MKLQELQSLLEGVQYRIAVYDELIAYLKKCRDEGIEIPTDLGDGTVPEDHIRFVLAEIQTQQAALVSKLDLVENVEVKGVTAQDFAFS